MTHYLLDDLIKQVQSEDASARLQAIKALEQHANKVKILPILEQLLGDESISVVRASTLALGRIGGCEQLSVLVPLLEHDSLWVQKASVQALGLLGCPEVVPTLVRLLDHEALQALSREALIALKVDPDFF